VAKTLGDFSCGPVTLVDMQKVGIKYKKPPRSLSASTWGGNPYPVTAQGK
jgi:hypothetical protein